MANRFNYESPIDRLLSVTLPQFVSKERDREESSRRFDAQMIADSDKTDQAQANFDKNFKLQEDQLDVAKEERDYKRTFEEEKIFLTELTDDKFVSGKLNRISAVEEKDEEGNFTGNYIGITHPTIIRSIKSRKKKLLSQQTENKSLISDFNNKDSVLGNLLSYEANKINPDFNKIYLQHLTANNVSNATTGQVIMKAFGDAGVAYREQQKITELSPSEENNKILLSLKNRYNVYSSKVDSFIENNSTMNGKKGSGIKYKGTYEDPVIIDKEMVNAGLQGIDIGKIVQFDNKKTGETVTGVVESIDESGSPVILTATPDPVYNQDTTAQLFEGISQMEIIAPPKEDREIPALYKGRPISSSVVNTLMKERSSQSKMLGRKDKYMWLDDFAKIVLDNESATGSSLQTKKGKKALMEYNKGLKR